MLGLALAALLTGSQVDDAALAVKMKVDRLYAEGEDALQAERFTDALRLAKEALTHEQGDPRLWILLGATHCELADSSAVETDEDWARVGAEYHDSEQALRAAIDLDPSCAEAWAKLGHTLMRMGNSEEAIATLYHALSFQGTGIRVQLDLADALLLSRQYAVEAGNFDHADSRLEEAEKILRGALESIDVQADVLNRLGQVLVAKGQYHEALQSFRRAISLRPADTTIHDAHIDAMEQSKAFEEGAAFYQGLVDEPALSQWYGAVTQELRGHLAYNVDKDYAEATHAYERAEAMFFESVKGNPSYARTANQRIPLVRSYRGYALARSGRLEEAEAAFLSALDRDPGLDNARQGLKLLMDEYWNQVGGESATAEDFDRIRSFAARMAIVSPRDPDIWNNYGFFAREAGLYEESYLAYRRALALAPDNPQILNDTALLLLYHLGRDWDLAEDWLLEARDLAEEQRRAAEGTAAKEQADTAFGDALANLVALLHSDGRTAEAEEFLAQLQSELPERPEVEYWLRKLHPEDFPEPEPQQEAAAEPQDATGEPAAPPQDAPPADGAPEE